MLPTDASTRGAKIASDRAEYNRKWKEAKRKSDPEWWERRLAARRAANFAKRNDAGRQRSRSDYNLRNKYGITLDDYERMLVEQDYTCKLCAHRHDDSKYSTKLVVDHCHDAGSVRGLLCRHCNTALGKLGDNVESLKRAITYMEATNG